MQGEQLYTVKEVAERLRVNPETVRVWLRTGRLKGVLIGGRKAGYRIPESDVQSILRAGLEGSSGEKPSSKP